MKIGIVGFGEIGSSLKKVYDLKNIDNQYNITVVDPAKQMQGDITGCDILNICIPYTDKFIDIVQDYIDYCNPALTVIHSTVAPGTTEKLNGNVCHSPVRGLHPNLDSGILTFLKYIGAENKEVAQRYSEHLADLGIESFICKNSRTSEYAKLLDTTYYGVCIAFHADVLNLCNKENIEFDEVMTIYNKTYNEGYSALGKANVVRPVLYGTNKIGGHCVVPNAKILKDYMNTKTVQSILEYE